MIYLDNSATTKPYSDVLDAYIKVSRDFFGNPSSLHPAGKQAERLLKQTREMAARLLNVKPAEILFTSGGTEGNNLAIKGTARRHKNRGKHLITTEAEHPSSFETFQELEREGFEVTWLPADETGTIKIEDLKAALRDDTILVSLIHVNNELGSVNPVVEAGEYLKKYPKIRFHVDHVQGIGKVPLRLTDAGIDFCTISGHKFHGVKGTGLLFAREGTVLSPLFSGGSQEWQMRAGTENPAGAAAMVKALRIHLEKSVSGNEKLNLITGGLIASLNDIRGIVVNTPEARAPHIVNFSVPGLKPEVLVQAYGEKGIYVSTKSACSSREPEPSRVLSACGFSREVAASGIRVSLSYDNTEEDIHTFLNYTKEIVPSLLEVAAK
ncbi:cysteine desulfurase family protein [Alteribacter natronophilus]|uniref:cysteine desulfurase family protein n=1 Tax=Alteribacter natronophilus TaxID=2583810 RepID=UPI00110D4408|nr:cysteine desulfurase family protein [Alteribacter natronophilus]TMW71736.1 cysteine desulfurase [Alteribacter natronophilus]